MAPANYPDDVVAIVAEARRAFPNCTTDVEALARSVQCAQRHTAERNSAMNAATAAIARAVQFESRMIEAQAELRGRL